MRKTITPQMQKVLDLCELHGIDGIHEMAYKLGVTEASIYSKIYSLQRKGYLKIQGRKLILTDKYNDYCSKRKF